MIIKRDYYLNQLIASKHNGLIKIVTGLRRSGKSYLLFHLFGDYLKEQGTPDNHIIKIDLEDRRNASLRDPDALLAHIDSKMVDDKMFSMCLNLKMCSIVTLRLKMLMCMSLEATPGSCLRT